tara:strand:- start:137 stop:427 length:291 start_codon:yes stop_codon:yes gene_type:complete
MSEIFRAYREWDPPALVSPLTTRHSHDEARLCGVHSGVQYGCNQALRGYADRHQELGPKYLKNGKERKQKRSITAIEIPRIPTSKKRISEKAKIRS